MILTTDRVRELLRSQNIEFARMFKGGGIFHTDHVRGITYDGDAYRNTGLILSGGETFTRSLELQTDTLEIQVSNADETLHTVIRDGGLSGAQIQVFIAILQRLKRPKTVNQQSPDLTVPIGDWNLETWALSRIPVSNAVRLPVTMNLMVDLSGLENLSSRMLLAEYGNSNTGFQIYLIQRSGEIHLEVTAGSLSSGSGGIISAPITSFGDDLTKASIWIYLDPRVGKLSLGNDNRRLSYIYRAGGGYLGFFTDREWSNPTNSGGFFMDSPRFGMRPALGADRSLSDLRLWFGGRELEFPIENEPYFTSAGIFETYRGIVDRWSLTESEETSAITIEVSSRWGEFNLTNGIIASDTDHQSRHPGDTIFETATEAPKPIDWGA